MKKKFLRFLSAYTVPFPQFLPLWLMQGRVVLGRFGFCCRCRCWYVEPLKKKRLFSKQRWGVSRLVLHSMNQGS